MKNAPPHDLCSPPANWSGAAINEETVLQARSRYWIISRTDYLYINNAQMKPLKALSIIACLLVISGAIMQIMHVEVGQPTLFMGISLFFIYLGLQSLYGKKQPMR